MDSVSLVVLLGTARENSQSKRVSTYIHERLAKREGVTAKHVCVADHLAAPKTVPPWDQKGTEHASTPWQEIARDADGFIFVLPEYNRGYPGEWKLLMDTLYTEYSGKVAGLVGVSDGAFGGARVVEHVKPVLTEFGFIVLNAAAHFKNVDTMFDTDARMLDEKQAGRIESYLDRVIDATIRYKK